MVRFFALSLSVTAALILLGYQPTVRLAGSAAVVGMLTGCGISLTASWIGAVPVAMAGRLFGADVPLAVLASTALRFVVVLVLALTMILSGWVDRMVLLIWVVISYLALLVVDTSYALKVSRDVETLKK